MSEVSSITRETLLKAFNNNLEVVKVFESLTQVVGSDGDGSLTQVIYTANQALAVTDALSLGVYRPVQPLNDVRGGDGIVAARDAAGPVLSLDIGYLAQANRAANPRQESPAKRDDDAGAIIASMVFGKR